MPQRELTVYEENEDTEGQKEKTNTSGTEDSAADALNISAESAVIMEASTGQILYE